MKEEIIYSMSSPFRDDFRIRGFRFGEGEKTLAVVGSLRGDEVQQLHTCAQLVKTLQQIEKCKGLTDGVEILVIPSANPFSMNIGKRFWAMDGTDINRMFPGYRLGETTQRIADALFKALQGYQYGVQMASSYVAGCYMPHVKLLHTGYEDIQAAGLFGLPYVCVRQPLPFDTTLLNYNWQIWETKAYSLYGGSNSTLDMQVSREVQSAVVRFMERVGLTVADCRPSAGYRPVVFDESELVCIKAPVSGIFFAFRKAGDMVNEGDLLAHIIHPYKGTVEAVITAPAGGRLFFSSDKSLALQSAPLFKICTA